MTRIGDFDLVTLKGGARAVRHTGHGEVMHPVGPWEEAQALYVAQSNLARRLAEDGPALVIHDVGLGAATNAVAAFTAARNLGDLQRRKMHVVSLEVDLAPARLALGDAVGFPFLSPWHDVVRTVLEHGRWEEGLLSWELHVGNALETWTRPLPKADLVFFDPFSPAANPTMWTPAAFALLRAHCRDDGAGCQLFTYSAATRTVVSLLLGGFFVGHGVATHGKTTTVAATRRELLSRPLDAAWLAHWERSSARAPHGGVLDAVTEAAVRAHPQFR